MEFVDFDETNFSWGAPRGMEKRVGTLRVCRFPDHEEVVHNFSCWHLTDSDIERIKESRRIYLDVLSFEHPPVMVTAYGPEWYYPKQVEDIRKDKAEAEAAESKAEG